MRWRTTLLPIVISLAIVAVDAQSRQIRIRGRPIQQEEENLEEEYVDEENTQQPALQYYTADSRNNNGRVVLVSSDDEYNGLYGKPTTPTPRARVDYNRPVAKSSTAAPRLKDQGSKPPPVQTIRNYSKVNDDGSFTFGYEAADGSFKEETRGTDCVVRGKYGYVDPDGNKREFTYVSGNPCDPNHPDETEEEPELSEEESNEPENIPQNYPRRPVKPLAPRPSARPAQTTTHAPTTVFQNIYSSAGYQESEEDEQPEPIQLLQQPQQFQRPRPAQAVRPLSADEVTIRQRPRITVANTTPTPAYNSPTKETHPVSITPRPTYRVSPQSLQTQPPATTYRPNVQFITQKPASISYSPSSTPSHLTVEPITKSAYATSRKPIDFANEFQKFQQAHNVQSTTSRPQPQQVKVFKPSPAEIPTSNPIYESQLVFDPSTGQYDSALYQQLPQSDGDFSLSHRIQPYVHQPEFHQPHQLFNLEQQNAQPLYHRPSPPPTRPSLQFPQFSQQVYQKDHENTQVLSSQQLYAQQQELQQQQLRQDRLESAKQSQAHRFQLQPQPIRQEFQAHQQPQGFYFVAPQQSSGQIDEFLRGHNIDFN